MASRQSLRFRTPLLAGAALLLLVGAACGGSDTADQPVDEADAPSAAETTPAVDAATDDPQPASSAAPAESVVPADTAPATETPTSSAVIEIALSDGRSWTVPAEICVFDPDASGPAAAVMNIGGADESGAGVNVLEAWPFDGTTDNGTSFLGNFVTEDEELFQFELESVTVVDGVVEVSVGTHSNLFFVEGDEPDGSATIRCEPS